MTSLGGGKAPMPGMDSNTSGMHGLAHMGTNVQSPTQTPFSPREEAALWTPCAAVPPRSLILIHVVCRHSTRFVLVAARCLPTEAADRLLSVRLADPRPWTRSPTACARRSQRSHWQRSICKQCRWIQRHEPQAAESILGSSALGGDDDIIDPKPRRSAIRSDRWWRYWKQLGGAGSSFFGGGAGAVGGASGVGSSSTMELLLRCQPVDTGPALNQASTNGGGAATRIHWVQSCFGQLWSEPERWHAWLAPTLLACRTGAQSRSLGAASTPVPGTVLASPSNSPGGNPIGTGSNGAGLGAHASGFGAHQATFTKQLGSGNGGMLSPFNLGAPGSGSRNLFGAPGSNTLHPGAIGTSPGSRHVSGVTSR